MKLSKFIHIGSATVGIIGVTTFITALIGGNENLVFGITKIDALLCSAILILIATWLQIATIHHMMLEKKRRNCLKNLQGWINAKTQQSDTSAQCTQKYKKSILVRAQSVG